MNKIKFVYFDLGGVLFNWKNALEKLAIYVDKSYEQVYVVFKKHDHKVCRGIMSVNRLWKYIKDELRIDVDMDDFLLWWADNFIPIKKSHDLIRKVVKKYRTGIVSNIYKGTYNLVLKKGQIPDLPYEIVIQSCDINFLKPEKNFFMYAQEKAKVKRDEILFIDDSKKNILAAQEFGWNTILFDESKIEESVNKVKSALQIS